MESGAMPMCRDAASVRVGLAATATILALSVGCGDGFTSGSGGAAGSGGSTTSTTSSSGGHSTTTTSASGGSGQTGGGPVGTGGGGGGATLNCHPGWDFYPAVVKAGTPFDVVYYTDQDGTWTWVKMSAAGSGSPQVTDPLVIGGTAPYQDYYAWRSTVTGHVAGELSMVFWENCNTNCTFVSTCTILIEPASP
jgi:hypothetical protein